MRPFGALEWGIAIRYLRSRRREAFISVISTLSLVGIALGVATLIIVMAVMNGFRAELFSKILGVSGHVLIQPLDGPLTDYREVAARIDALDDVTRAIPFVEGQVLVSGAVGSSGALVRGVSPEDFRRLDFVSGNILFGSDENFGKQKGAIIGSRLARQLGVTIGDVITLISPDGAVTPFGVTPRTDNYPVQAVFEIGMSEYDGSFIYLPLDRAQLYFNKEGTVSAIEVYAKDPDAMDKLRGEIDAVAERPLYILDWRQRNRMFFSALVVERNVMFIILTLIILVAALNVVSGMTMLVKEKTRDIAILRTIGATRGSVLRIFLMVGLSIGVVGTLIGFGLGTVIALNIEAIRQFLSSLLNTELFSPELYFLSQLPADMDSVETAAVVLMALGLSLLATIYPAWKAAKTDPVDALKAE
ncbi:lipoprotein-releasing ABC transporter permease subunit [Acuticoccus sp. M5D2P5]|uniref:lipoprotein-releasing ABC transporter permease subunit n=1 Tax=Acuticoccus kalidii TaxID=2910977 RepID=UPI001F42ECEA|nr:lipoprotein-releasing ABC transporter permease subunit [Acuticoccus kalidii]